LDLRYRPILTAASTRRLANPGGAFYQIRTYVGRTQSIERTFAFDARS
jgi:hypothetical protein